jgi:hypothetical protein
VVLVMFRLGPSAHDAASLSEDCVVARVLSDNAVYDSRWHSLWKMLGTRELGSTVNKPIEQGLSELLSLTMKA